MDNKKLQLLIDDLVADDIIPISMKLSMLEHYLEEVEAINNDTIMSLEIAETYNETLRILTEAQRNLTK